MNDERRAVLRAVCDTVYPRIERDDDPDGFFARSATDMGLPEAVEDLIEQIPDETIRGGLEQLLDVLGQQGYLRMPSQDSREQLLRNLALASPDAAAGVSALAGMTLFLAYGAPDPNTGLNPNWATFGYPGPSGVPPQVPKLLDVKTPSDGDTIDADVCIVGSGSGGGVIAGTLAKQGLKVVVLEASGYFNESDFAQLELQAYQEMFWRGGPTPSADGNISMQAGTTLGGGTTINWTNCLRTTDWVRSDWAGEHGLEGLDGTDYDRHLDTVLERIGATDRCSDLNGPQQRMKEAADELGWSFKTIVRNADPDKYSPDSAGYLGFGDQSGAKNSGDRTWLRDAQRERRRAVRAQPRTARAHRERPRRGRRGRPCRRGRERARQLHGPGSDRGRGVRLARIARASPAQRHRRPGRRQLSAAASVRRDHRLVRRGPARVVGRAAGGAGRRVRQRRERLRVPDRERPVRARA